MISNFQLHLRIVVIFVFFIDWNLFSSEGEVEALLDEVEPIRNRKPFKDIPDGIRLEEELDTLSPFDLLRKRQNLDKLAISPEL